MHSQRTQADQPIRAHLLICGRVQGVGFRFSTIREAARIGALDGWVRNLLDGRVEAVAEGERRRVERFVAWCHQGPRHAMVEKVDVSWEAARGDLPPFDIHA
ncbi:MAG TPA: acylphosphatase [Anaeromyxobacteraceae bacterium]|nr:acylphosphatase [Anaeromyxobacteraceae bacterium]